MLQLSIIHLDEILTIAKSSGCLRDQIISLLHMTRPNRESSGWHPAVSIRRPDELRQWANSSRWLKFQIALWHTAVSISHPDEMLPIAKSSGWLGFQISLCHPDEIAPGRISSWRIITHAGCHPDEKTNLITKSSGWLSYSRYLIRMTYGHCRLSSGWLTILPYLIQMT